MNADPQSHKDLGDRLRQIRRRAGLTQVETARALSLMPSTLSQYESGKRRVDALTLDRLSQLYGVPVADFFVEHAKGGNWEAALRREASSLSTSKIGVNRLIANLRDLEDSTGAREQVIRGFPFPCSRR